MASMTQSFSGIVEGAGGFIKYQDTGALVERARDADTLALTAREPHPTLTDGGSITLWLGLDEFRDLCTAGRVAYALEVDRLPGDSEGYVLRECRIGQVDALGYVSNRSLPRAHAWTTDRLSVNQDLAFGWREQTHQ